MDNKTTLYLPNLFPEKCSKGFLTQPRDSTRIRVSEKDNTIIAASTYVFACIMRRCED